MDLGVKVSRKGYDVFTASDRQLTFSSEWPLLPIEAEGEILLDAPVGGGNVNEVIFKHNLGYTPVFTTTRVSGNPFYWHASVYADKTELVFDGYLANDITIKWKVFRRDIKTHFVSTVGSIIDDTRSVDDDYGIVISLPGKEVSSTNKRDFGIRSDVRQLMIAQSGHTINKSINHTITHGLGYKPLFFCFHEDSAIDDKWYALASADDLKINATPNELSINFYTLPFWGLNWGWIIFKDTLVNNG